MKGSNEMDLHDYIGKQVIVNLIDTAKKYRKLLKHIA